MWMPRHWRRNFLFTLAEIKAKIISGTLREVEVDALVVTTAHTLSELRRRIMRP